MYRWVLAVFYTHAHMHAHTQTPSSVFVQFVCVPSCYYHTVKSKRVTAVLCGCELYSCECVLYISPQLVGVSGLLSQCRTIRSFQLYLNKGPEALTALSHCLEGMCRNPSIEDVLICCLDAGQWRPALGLLLCSAVWCTSFMALSVSNVLMNEAFCLNEVFCLTGVPQVQVLLLHNSFPMWWVAC